MARNLKSEWIYQTLRKDILELTYQPGDKISEVLIAERYNTSRGPARDALTRLQQDGLIKIEPQVGSYIAEISLEQLYDMLQVRLALEPLAAKMAVDKISPIDILEIKKEFAIVKRMESNKKVSAQKQIDRKLHLLLLDRCENEYIKKFGREMFLQSEWVQLYTTLYTAQRREESLKETENILEALEKGNSQDVYMAVETHLKNICEAFIQSADLIKKPDKKNEYNSHNMSNSYESNF